MSLEKLSTRVRQEQIAEAALALVNERGMGALSMAAVARRVGIVPSGIYRHYRNKSDLVAAVLGLIRKRLEDNFESLRKTAGGPLDKLEALLERHVGLIHENHAIPRIIFSEEVIGGHPDKRRQLYEIIERVIGQVSVLLEEGQERGEIRTDLTPDRLAVIFLGIIQPAAIIWHLSRGRLDLLTHTKNAWDFYREGLRP
jgi:AcrR family transcriptional regulator